MSASAGPRAPFPCPGHGRRSPAISCQSRGSRRSRRVTRPSSRPTPPPATQRKPPPPVSAEHAFCHSKQTPPTVSTLNRFLPLTDMTRPTLILLPLPVGSTSFSCRSRQEHEPVASSRSALLRISPRPLTSRTSSIRIGRDVRRRSDIKEGPKLSPLVSYVNSRTTSPLLTPSVPRT
ncbi:hypothetical protein NDU88_004704 [Pleurodeles waltl]|uniref:Uncharacterized protein n=1 Tax=Pleurodeles waltl TaxID=8319 RepID=A0AAV7TAH5_PLEWA|nr:hypothetical protein NDU88_004704 [Pleurodeles waltl]